MRQVLVDHARRRSAAKRGQGERPVTLSDAIAALERPDDLLAVEEALTALAEVDERKARAIELHYFGGLTQPEIAGVLSVHVNTVARDLRLAEAWIHRYLTSGAPPG
jgi:RNA polymerase sigma factor (TIGR02999 family)